MANEYQFEGGRYLTKIGASWFVSYKYHQLIDKNHKNWTYVETVQARESNYYNSEEYHELWLNKVIYEMNPNKLNTNKIHLNAREVKKMAKIILDKYYGYAKNDEAKTINTTNNNTNGNDNYSVNNSPLSSASHKKRNFNKTLLYIFAALALYYFFK